MLKQRVITALAVLAALGIAWALGPLPFAAALVGLVAVAAYEWLRLARHSTAVGMAVAIALCAALLALEVLGATRPGQPTLVLYAIACVCWAGIGVLIFSAAKRGATIDHRISTALCIVLIAAAWFALTQLLRSGLVYLLSVLAIVWLADIAGYFVGRALGRRKLAPGISPGKTWAGAVGAITAVPLIASALAWMAPQLDLFSSRLALRTSLLTAMVALLILVALSIVGDLFESLLKRQVGAKDSGTLLPGHGGVLDRIDALLAVLPAAALLDLWMRA